MQTSVQIDSDLVEYIDQYVHRRGDFSAIFAQMVKIGGACYDDYISIMKGGGGKGHPYYEGIEPKPHPLTSEQESKIRIAIMLDDAFKIKKDVRYRRCMKGIIFEQAQYNEFKADAKKHNINISTYLKSSVFYRSVCNAVVSTDLRRS